MCKHSFVTIFRRIFGVPFRMAMADRTTGTVTWSFLNQELTTCEIIPRARLHTAPYGLVSLGLHCFLRLERALCWRSGRCLVGDAFSV